MNYRRRRWINGLSAYTISKELGVDYNKYLEVEKGTRALEKEYVDKFNEIIDNATEIRLNHKQRMENIKQEYISGALKERIKEYGYSYTELGSKLGLSQGAISNAFSGNSKLTSEETMERIYDFLQEPFNKKTKAEREKTKVKRTLTRGKASDEVENWYKSINLGELVSGYFGKKKQIAKQVGITPEHLSNVINGKRNPSVELKEKLYNLLHGETTNETTMVEEPEVIETNVVVEPTDTEKVEPSVVEEDVKIFEPKETDSKDLLIARLDLENKKLRHQIEMYEKLIERL